MAVRPTRHRPPAATGAAGRFVAIDPLVASVPAGGLWLLLAGGLSYTVGVIFYRWHRLRYHHAVWHTFVLGGSTCHFLAVLLFLLPRAV